MTDSLSTALETLGETMADNLVAMGVTDASASDGLTTLSGKILDIAPSVGGITPTVTIDLSKNIANPVVGHDVVLSAKVNADYDDESQLDIDLHGYLQGASVLFKNGNTSLATTVSDNIGIATYTIQNIQAGSYGLTGFFDGTGTDYESATSNALTFTVSVTPTLSLSSSSLTPSVGDTITLTASVVDNNNNPVADYPIQLYKDGTSMGSQYKSITNSQGVATITYTVVDSTSFVLNINGDTSTNTTITPVSSIILKDGILDTDTWHRINNSHTMTVSDGMATGYNELMDFSVDMTLDWEIDFDYKNTVGQTDCGAILADVTNTNDFDYNAYYVLVWDSGVRFSGRTGNRQTFQYTLNQDLRGTWVSLKIIKENGDISCYANGTLIGTHSELGVINNICLGTYSWSSHSSSIKNLLIKQL